MVFDGGGLQTENVKKLSFSLNFVSVFMKAVPRSNADSYLAGQLIQIFLHAQTFVRLIG